VSAWFSLAWHELIAADQSIMTILVAGTERVAFDSFVSGLRQAAGGTTGAERSVSPSST